MLSTVMLLGLTLVAAATDVLRNKIYNWNTYSGILAGLALSAVRQRVAVGRRCGGSEAAVLARRAAVAGERGRFADVRRVDDRLLRRSSPASAGET